MLEAHAVIRKRESFAQRHPVVTYFALMYAISWTGALLMALPHLLMHASSTSALAVFSPPGVSAAQEVVWYLVYGAALWAVVVMVIRRGFGRIAAGE